MSYNTKVYVEQGGETQVIASGGTQSIEDGGKVVVPVTTGSTASTSANFGLTVFGSTAAKTYAMAAPVAGVVKHLVCTAGSTGALQLIDGGSGVTFDGTKRYLRFNAAEDAVILVGQSATRWRILSNIGSVVTSTGN